jgi:hypothetical protein
MFTVDQIRKFQLIYKEVIGIEISKDEAIKNGIELLNLYEQIIKIKYKLSGGKNDGIQKD